MLYWEVGEVGMGTKSMVLAFQAAVVILASAGALFAQAPTQGKIGEIIDPGTNKIAPPVAQAAIHFEKRIAAYRDVFTLPKTKGPECTKVCTEPLTGWKYCCEYSTSCQWMECAPTLIVDISPAADIGKAIDDCHTEAVGAGLVSAIVSAAAGGGWGSAKAAVDSYVAYMQVCLVSRIQEKILSIRVEPNCNWGPWVGC